MNAHRLMAGVVLALGVASASAQTVTLLPPLGHAGQCVVAERLNARAAGRLDLIGQTCANGYADYTRRYFQGQWAQTCGAPLTLIGLHSIVCIDTVHNDGRPRAQYFAQACCAEAGRPARARPHARDLRAPAAAVIGDAPLGTGSR
jgi:hypothetical protein